MEHAESTIRVLDALKRMGVRISIDDFGTGYSSLSNLKRFPIHSLKIDRGFVADIDGGGEGGAIVKAVIALARSLISPGGLPFPSPSPPRPLPIAR